MSKDYWKKKKEEQKRNKQQQKGQQDKNTGDRNDQKGYPEQPGANDFSWHTPDAKLLEDASSMPWTFQTGEILPMTSPMYSGVDDPSYTNASQAGFVVIRDHISVGGIGHIDQNTTQEVSTLPTYNAANTILTEMRSKTRVRNTYDAPDVMMLMLSMLHIYIAVIFFKRVLATLKSFSYQNHYMPKALIEAQGFDYEDIRKHSWSYIARLNTIISEINKIYIPNRMHFFELISERFANYYTEGDSIKDQIYLFVPATLDIYELNPNANYASWVRPFMVFPGKLTGVIGPTVVSQYDATGLYTGDQFLDMLQVMVNAVISDTATADITGDMMNAFGEANRFTMVEADRDSVAIPHFNEEILETIHNLTHDWVVSANFINLKTDSSYAGQFATSQDANDNRIGTEDLYLWPYSSAIGKYEGICSCRRMLDVHANPDPQKTFAITRLHNITGTRRNTIDPTTLSVQVVFASDLICDVQFYYIEMSGGIPTVNNFRMDPLLVVGAAADVVRRVRQEAFHYRPLLPCVDSNFDPIATWYSGETDIVAFLDGVRDINNMNRISLLTLLGAYDNVK